MTYFGIPAEKKGTVPFLYATDSDKEHAMTKESLGSKEAQEKIDEVAGEVYEDFHVYFNWGYEFGQLDAHRVT